MADHRYEDGRKYDVGDIVGDDEVTQVSYKEDESGKRHTFTYGLRDKAELYKERAAEKARQDAEKERAAEQARQEAEAAKAQES